MKNAIPHIIHYCWFGNHELPPLEKACMKTWSKLKGYKVMRWDETTFDIENANQYVREAYENKKYAFVSDYVRLYALYQYGGVYLDTDVEVYRDFSPVIDEHDVVAGFEFDTITASAFIASRPECSVIKDLLDEYDNRVFLNEDGTLDTLPINFGWTRTLENHGIVLNGQTQTVCGGADIFVGNWHYFNGTSTKTWYPTYSDETYTVHHYSGSWKKQPGIKRVIGSLKNRFKLLVGFQNYARIQRFTEIFNKRLSN